MDRDYTVYANWRQHLGPLGAKRAGAGDGGTIIALWPSPDTAPLEQALCATGACAIYRPLAVPGVTIEEDGPAPLHPTAEGGAEGEKEHRANGV